MITKGFTMITLDSLQKVKPLWRGDLSMNTFIELSADFVFKLYISEGSVYLQTELWHNTTTFSNLKIDWNWSFTTNSRGEEEMPSLFVGVLS